MFPGGKLPELCLTAPSAVLKYPSRPIEAPPTRWAYQWRHLRGYPDDGHYSYREARTSRGVDPAAGASPQDYAVRRHSKNETSRENA